MASVFVGGILAVAAAPALATWSSPADLSSFRNNENPEVAVGADGATAFVWQAEDRNGWERVAARTGRSASDLGRIWVLSRAGYNAVEPRVAVDADGDAVFVWLRDNGVDARVQMRAFSREGVLSPIQTLTPAGKRPFDAQVAVDPAGDAVFAWRQWDGTSGRIQARFRSAAGALSSTQNLSRADEVAFDPHLGVDADGDAVVTWRVDDQPNDAIQARARSAAGVLGPIQEVSNEQDFANFSPGVAVEPDGDAVLAWLRSDSNGSQIVTRVRSGTGALAPIEVVAGGQPFDAHVGVDADGDAVFGWISGSPRLVRTRARSAAGAFSPIQTLSTASSALGIDMAVDGDGDAVYTWTEDAPVTSDRRPAVRSRSAAGVLSPTTFYTPLAGEVFFSEIAAGAGGRATVTWHLRTDHRTNILGAFGP